MRDREIVTARDCDRVRKRGCGKAFRVKCGMLLRDNDGVIRRSNPDSLTPLSFRLAVLRRSEMYRSASASRACLTGAKRAPVMSLILTSKTRRSASPPSA
jgi:hypothetical protein